MSKYLFLFVSIFLYVQAQQIVDFTYSHYLQKGSPQGVQGPKIDIRAHEQTLDKYTFPQACYIGRKLSLASVDSISELEQKNLDSYLNNLKNDFTDLLKISQKIKGVKKNIEQYSSLSTNSQKASTVSPKDLQLLEKYENKLKSINDQIENYTLTLEEFMDEAMSNSKNNQFNEATINFEVQSLQLKLRALENLLNEVQLNRPVTDTDFQKYFGDLKNKFDQQSVLIDDLNSLLQNFNELAQLKAQISNLKSQIQAHSLLITDKEICAQDINEIRKKQKQNKEIKQLMKSLRAKKIEYENIPNKYCQGVAKKLQDQVKKLLKVYNYVFSCAEGKQQLIDIRAKQEKQLAQAEDRLKQLQNRKGLDEYNKKIEANRNFMKNKIDQINSFKLKQYSHNPDEIKILINNTKLALEEAKKKKNKELPIQGDKSKFDYQVVQDLVNKIKKLKGSFCREHQLYNEKAKEVWQKVYKYEEEVQFSSKMHKLYTQEINKLRQYEIIFQELRTKIMNRMK